MKKNSSIYNNKRFAQFSNNFDDYDRNPNIPEPSARAQNWVDWAAYAPSIDLISRPAYTFYPDSIKNAKSFEQSSIFRKNEKFNEEIRKFISNMILLNDGKEISQSDESKVSWLRKNKIPLDQYNEFTNWSQSERQKYKDRFNKMSGTRRGEILKKALIALKNAEIAAAKVSFQYNPGVKAAEYMSDVSSNTASSTTSGTPQKPSASGPSASGQSTSGTSTSEPISQSSAKKPEKPQYNNSFITSIKNIEDANDLLYHAAKRALGLKEVNIDSYYTNENAQKIRNMINKIADSQYMNKHNSKLKKLRSEALEDLESKINKNNKPSTSDPTSKTLESGAAGKMSVIKEPDGQSHLESPVKTKTGDDIRDLLDVAEDLTPEYLKSLWTNIRKKIISLLNDSEIDNLERIEFEDRIKAIDLRFNLAFHPEGGKQTASGAFFVYTPEDLAKILRAALKAKDIKKANDAIDKLKIIFEENSSFVPYQQFKTVLRQEIKQYNFRNPDNQVNDLPR